jgi:iron(III) transport system permease protein
VNKKPNKAIRIWLVIGMLAYVLLPWYAIQNTAWYSVLPQIMGGPETANGIVQAVVHGRKWLLVGLIGMVIAVAGLSMPAGKAQGNWFLAGGLVGFAGLLASAFLIGTKGWSFDFFNAQFGVLAKSQFGMGVGACVALLALGMITALGVERCGILGSLFLALRKATGTTILDR